MRRIIVLNRKGINELFPFFKLQYL